MDSLYIMSRDRPVSGLSADALVARLRDVRAQLLALADALPADGWLGPRAAHLNPPLWELGHIAWFQERWCLRAQPAGDFAASLLDAADALYDSSTVPHDTRWDLPLLAPAEARAYAETVLSAASAQLQAGLTADRAYFAELCLYHELMHVEAWRMAFQNLGYAPPGDARTPAPASGAAAARLQCAGGTVMLGSGADEGFIFDNEKWRHAHAVEAFDIDARPVSQATFAAFVDAGAYVGEAGWSDAGLAWRAAERPQHPLYWRRADGVWQFRHFDGWRPLEPEAPMLHVNRHEAEACAHWLGRALPTAAQWLHASARPDFESGQAWEWLHETFAPYPGFSPDPYAEYSAPWFHTHVELRGGSRWTDDALKRPGFRNFYLPHRRDPFAGFRTVSRG